MKANFQISSRAAAAIFFALLFWWCTCTVHFGFPAFLSSVLLPNQVQIVQRGDYTFVLSSIVWLFLPFLVSTSFTDYEVTSVSVLIKEYQRCFIFENSSRLYSTTFIRLRFWMDAMSTIPEMSSFIPFSWPEMKSCTNALLGTDDSAAANTATSSQTKLTSCPCLAGMNVRRLWKWQRYHRGRQASPKIWSFSHLGTWQNARHWTVERCTQ